MFTYKVEIYHRWQLGHDHLAFSLDLGPSFLVTWDPNRGNLPSALFIDLVVGLIFWTVTVTLSWTARR